MAGPHVRNACRRHLEDLAHGAKRGLAWDAEAAKRGLGFFREVLCLAGGEFEGRSFELHPSQTFIIGSLFGWMRADGTRRFRRAYIEQGKGNGKALALDTPIPTPSGWTTMGEIRAGDLVLDDSGHPCRVTQAHPVQTERPCFQVRFDDGASIVADAEHLWLTVCRNFGSKQARRATFGVPKNRLGAWRRGLRTTRQIAATLRYPNGRYHSANHSVALCGPVDLPMADLPIEPYTLGVWLGDGDSDGARITVGEVDVELLAHLAEAGTAVGPRRGGPARASRYRIGSRPDLRRGAAPEGAEQSLNEKLRRAGLLGDKHIPQAYLRASALQRQALLQGLMDTDGHIAATGRCELTLTCEALARGALELVLSLGLKASWAQDRARLDGRDVGPRYRVAFNAPDDLRVFRLSRKDARQKVHHTRRRRSGQRCIVACERVASVPVRCISVDSPSRMYLAGHHFVPTHNSPVAAGLGMYGLLADSEPRAEIYAAASKKDQAMVLFRDAVAMYQQSPALARRLTHSGGNPVWNLAAHASGSWFRPISSDDGQSGPRPHMALLDELHEHRDGRMVEMLERGFKSRRQPLLVMITNSGSDRNSVCWQEHQHAVRVAAGTMTPDDEWTYVGEPIDDSEFAYVCALDKGDDPLEDPSCWVKTNPLLGVTVKADYLAGVVKQAKAIPGKLNGILRLHFCVWTDAEEAWMTRPTLEAVLADFDPLELAGKPVYLGADLSGSQDLTALAFCTPTGSVEVERDGRKIVLPTFDAWVEAWTPRDTLAERALRDQMPYEVWAREGWLNAIEGKTIRLDFVAARIAEACAEYDAQILAYDRYSYRRLADELDALGVTLLQVEHPQGGIRRAKPTEEQLEQAKLRGEEPPQGLWMPGSVSALEELILERRIRIRRSPVTIAAMMSAAVERDAFDNRWFSKRRAVNRIDCLVALAMAVGAAVAAPASSSPSTYEERGLLIL